MTALMDLKKLQTKLTELNQPAFRMKQIVEAYFRAAKKDWEEVTVLPKELREQLSAEVAWDNIKLDQAVTDKKDGTIKAVFSLADGERVESVLINHKDGRHTVCVSSQAGCPLKCAFCATGQHGFKRNLKHYEIEEQVLYFSRLLAAKNEKVTNLVFMGMGEPLLNYEEVWKAVKVFNEPTGFNLGARHISISTCGIVPGIKRLAKEDLQINLALSLHSPLEKMRSQIMPINELYGLKDCLAAVDYYIEQTNRRVMVEYLLINGLNDSAKDAQELANLIKKRPLCFINLIPYNSGAGKFTKSPAEKIKEFTDILVANEVRYTLRHSFGEDIFGACGQLAGIGKKKKGD